MGEVISLEIAPRPFDFVEFRSVLGPPLGGEPMLAGCQRGTAELAGVDLAVVEDQHPWHERLPALEAGEAVELLQQADEVVAALGPGRHHDEAASGMIENAQHSDFASLPRCWNAQVEWPGAEDRHHPL